LTRQYSLGSGRESAEDCEISSLYDQLSTPLGSEASNGSSRRLPGARFQRGSVGQNHMAVLGPCGRDCRTPSEAYSPPCVAQCFLQPIFDRYRSFGETRTHLWSRFGFSFFGPAFYVVFMILPMSFGLLASLRGGLLGLREWARKGTLFLATVPVLVCVLLVLFIRARFFPPRPRPGSNTCFWRRCLSALFVCLLVVLISKHMVANMAHSRKRSFSISIDRPISQQGDMKSGRPCFAPIFSRAENNHSVPNFETLEKWARALEVPMYQLFYDGDEPPKLPICQAELV